jgi:LacI family transcriptional regulator
MKGPTISDVARQAGVSVASVSRVLNRKLPISNENRKRVTAAIEKLGYEPRRTPSPDGRAVAIVIPDPFNSCFIEIVHGVEALLLSNGYLPTIFFARTDDDYRRRLFHFATRPHCEGLIVISGGEYLRNEDLVDFREHTKKPVVTINRNTNHPDIPSICVNYSDAMYYAIRHLLSLNHRRFTFFSGPANAYNAIEKRKGVERALGEAGLSIDPDLWLVGAPTVEGGYIAMNTVFKLPVEKRPSAIVAFSDLRAFGAMHAIRAAKSRVPEDFSVIGFDDLDMATHSNPPLTTVAPPKQQMGGLAAQILLDYISGKAPQLEHYVAMESPIVVRESTSYCKNTQ